MKSCTIAFFLCFLLHYSFAQSGVSDSAFYNTLLSHTYQLYTGQMAGGSQLYNGTEYIGTHPTVKGHPFFESADFQKGTVLYDGVLYNDVPLKYDIVSDEIVIQGWQSFAVQLIKEKVDSFYLLRHSFARLIRNNANADFYDIVYNGSAKVLVKRKKEIARSFDPADPSVFKQYNDYYIKKDNSYYKIDSKNVLMDALKDKSNEMKNFWNQNHLNFKKEPEATIVSIVTYYDQLNK